MYIYYSKAWDVYIYYVYIYWYGSVNSMRYSLTCRLQNHCIKTSILQHVYVFVMTCASTPAPTINKLRYMINIYLHMYTYVYIYYSKAWYVYILCTCIDMDLSIAWSIAWHVAYKIIIETTGFATYVCASDDLYTNSYPND